MKRKFTGMLDNYKNKIYEGDTLRIGMRRGDARGWSDGEKVIRKYSKLLGLFRNENWSEWCLVNSKGERMDMQLDQELREIQNTSKGAG